MTTTTTKNLLISTQATGEDEKNEHKNDEMVTLCVVELYASGFDSYFGTQKDVVVKQKRCKQLNVIEWKKGEKN